MHGSLGDECISYNLSVSGVWRVVRRRVGVLSEERVQSCLPKHVPGCTRAETFRAYEPGLLINAKTFWHLNVTSKGLKHAFHCGPASPNPN